MGVKYVYVYVLQFIHRSIFLQLLRAALRSLYIHRNSNITWVWEWKRVIFMSLLLVTH